MLAQIEQIENFDFNLDALFEFGLRRLLDGLGRLPEPGRTSSRSMNGRALSG